MAIHVLDIILQQITILSNFTLPHLFSIPFPNPDRGFLPLSQTISKCALFTINAKLHLTIVDKIYQNKFGPANLH